MLEFGLKLGYYNPEVRLWGPIHLKFFDCSDISTKNNSINTRGQVDLDHRAY